MTVQIASIFDKASTLKDRSVKMEFVSSRELGHDNLATLFELRGQEGWLLFAPNKLTDKDIPDEPAHAEVATKSPSARLRDVLYVLWKQLGEPEKDFELFYASRMNRIIDQVKEKLEPING